MTTQDMGSTCPLGLMARDGCLVLVARDPPTRLASAVVVLVLCAILGAVALGALAGAPPDGVPPTGAT